MASSETKLIIILFLTKKRLEANMKRSHRRNYWLVWTTNTITSKKKIELQLDDSLSLQNALENV